jgi:GTP pyrophosphokinase
MPLVSPLLKEAASYLPREEVETVRQAYECAKSIYEGPLIIHAEKIARSLLHLHLDARTIVTALLQYAHAKEDIQEIEKKFGKKVVRTISSLAVLERGSGRSSTYSAAYIRKMALALSEDVRVLLIWLHNCRHMLEQSVSDDQKHQRALAREVLDVFAPMAARLGMYSLKYNLETLAFSLLYPEEAADIDAGLKALRREQGSFLNDSARTLKRLFLQEGRRAEILAREKHPFSIFRKMQQKGCSAMTDLHDLFGLRILVDNEEECYQVLGIIHRTYRPILHRVKDYIAFPKPNGYRSIHTTILGLNVRDPSLPVEIQIRTQDMHEKAEYGIAAHWNYKEGGREDPTQHKLWEERMHALRKLSSATQGTEEALSDILSDRIYVLTPQGDPIELPKGATPLDFAFRVHTDIGLCFRAAKVNGSIAPIDQILENGDMVEIVKQKIPRPSSQWLQIVRTGEARSKLRGFFRLEKPLLPLETRSIEQKEWRRQALHMSAPIVHAKEEQTLELDGDTLLPHRFAKCCTPNASPITTIVGFITRSGMVNIHRRNCRMLHDANPDRLIQARWLKGAPSRAGGPARRPPAGRAGSSA